MSAQDEFVQTQTRLPSRKIVNEDGTPVLIMRVPTDPESAELFEWWMHTAFEDFVATVPKMLEYGGSTSRKGSADLRLVGEAQMELLEWPVTDENLAVAQEIGVYNYCIGKLGRLISDYQNRRKGKADTWFDISIYAMMARRIQSVGRWP